MLLKKTIDCCKNKFGYSFKRVSLVPEKINTKKDLIMQLIFLKKLLKQMVEFNCFSTQLALI